MPFGVEDYINKMESYVKGSTKTVTKFINLCQEVVDALNYIAESKGNADKKILLDRYSNFLKTAPYTLQDVLDSLRIPYRAQKIITAYWCYIGMDTKDMSFTIFGAMFHKYLTKGAYIPRYRSHGYTAALDKKIRETGGKILYNTRVAKFW